MNALKCLMVGFTGVCLLSGGPVDAQGQLKSVVIFSQQALENLKPLLEKADKDEFRIFPGLSIFGGWLQKPKGTARWEYMLTAELKEGKEYRVIGAGDNDSEDLDLRILDAKGVEVASDGGTAKEAEVSFRPKSTQNYRIEMRLYKAKDNCVCLGVLLEKR